LFEHARRHVDVGFVDDAHGHVQLVLEAIARRTGTIESR